MPFVDANIFIRFLTNDNPVKAIRCLKLFQNAHSGKIRLQSAEAIIAEVVFVLHSPKLYRLSPKTIAEKLTPHLKNPGLFIPHKRTLLHALQIYSQLRLDFEDALLIAHMLRTKTKEVFTYDEEFDKVKEITRLEP